MQYQVDPMLQTQETHFQIVQKYIFLISESSSMSITIAKACKPFRSIKILKKMAKKLIFGCLGHSKRHFCGN